MSRPQQPRGRFFAKANTQRRGIKNGLESDYANRLELRQKADEIVGFRFEGMRFRLGKGTYYTPDFVVITSEGAVECHETKGHWREAARVRIKVAAREFPWFRFVAVTRPPREDWQFEEIEP